MRFVSHVETSIESYSHDLIIDDDPRFDFMQNLLSAM